MKDEAADLERRKLEKYRLEVLGEVTAREAEYRRVSEQLELLSRKIAAESPQKYFITGDVAQMQMAQAKSRDLLQQKQELLKVQKEREIELARARQILKEVDVDLSGLSSRSLGEKE